MTSLIKGGEDAERRFLSFEGGGNGFPLSIGPEFCTNCLLRLEAPSILGSFRDFDPHHMGHMPAGQNHSNFALNKGLSAPRYDNWCKIQVGTFPTELQ